MEFPTKAETFLWFCIQTDQLLFPSPPQRKPDGNKTMKPCGNTTAQPADVHSKQGFSFAWRKKNWGITAGAQAQRYPKLFNKQKQAELKQ